MAVKKILDAIYEPRFLNCMYGFRPNRGCHEAIKEVYQRISYGKISYIVDADIKGFFDHIDHEWMMKFQLGTRLSNESDACEYIHASCADAVVQTCSEEGNAGRVFSCQLCQDFNISQKLYKELKERMEKFGLELESSKSRLIEFGRFAEQNRRARGEHKPETFDFLGNL